MLRYIPLWILFIVVRTNAGEIALTFDDATTGDSAIMSGVARTQHIIKSLRAARVPDALFFVTTGNIGEDGKARLEKYTEAGFHLANHSHQHGSANKLRVNEFMIDTYQAHLILKDYENTLPYFRFPYLHYGNTKESIATLQSRLAELGYRNGYVTVDNYDWYINSAMLKARDEGRDIDVDKLKDVYISVLWQSIEFYDGLAKKTLGRSPKHVLLLHENDAAALFLPDLVKYIRDKGWKIISPQEAYSDPIAKGFPDVVFHKQGRVAALANAKGEPPENLRHASEDTEYLDSLMEKSSVFGR